VAGRRAAELLAGVVILFAVAGLAFVGLLAATGQPAGPALAALWRGSVGSADAVVSATLVRATPLVLAGLAVALAFRAALGRRAGSRVPSGCSGLSRGCSGLLLGPVHGARVGGGYRP